MALIEPPLKWAGGKRWMARSFPWLLPEEFNDYFEPFLGGASVFLHLSPDRAYLSDLNDELIKTYRAIREDWKAVWAALEIRAREHSSEFYYAERSATYGDRFAKAARFLYLNRTCWNGLYRVNLKGQFNVPRGTKNVVLFGKGDLRATSAALKRAELSAGDFEAATTRCQHGDFVFYDPPYTVLHNNNGFLKYNERIFSWADQIRLRNCAVAAANRGAKVLVLNADHSSVRDLYEGKGTLHSLKRHSVISGKAESRRPIKELAIQIGYRTTPRSAEAVP